MAGLVSDIFTDADVKVTSAQAGNSTFANGASGVFIEDLEDDSVLFSNSSTSALTNAANVSWGGSAVDGVTEKGWYGFGVRTDSTEHFLEDYERLLELYNTA
jgi:hypothetical protein